MVRMDFQLASTINFLTIFITIIAILRIKRWIKRELAEPHGREWKCKKDGLFVIYLALVLILFMAETAIGLLDFSVINQDDSVDSNEGKWVLVNISNILFTIFSFLATMFILIFMVKMSRAMWSELPDEEKSRRTTMMDREVADGWFDKTRLDLDYKFVSYTHNIPE